MSKGHNETKYRQFISSIARFRVALLNALLHINSNGENIQNLEFFSEQILFEIKNMKKNNQFFDYEKMSPDLGIFPELALNFHSSFPPKLIKLESFSNVSFF